MKWTNIKWRIHYWLYYDSPIYINTLDYRKLFREWEPVKKYFMRPSLRYAGHWYENWKRIFRFEIRPLMWKTKYREYRHEEDPEIRITIFGHVFRWKVSPEKNNGDDISLQYYETILLLNDYLKKYPRAKAVYKAISDNTWDSGFDENRHKIDCSNMLTFFGRYLYDTYKDSSLNVKSSSV